MILFLQKSTALNCPLEFRSLSQITSERHTSWKCTTIFSHASKLAVMRGRTTSLWRLLTMNLNVAYASALFPFYIVCFCFLISIWISGLQDSSWTAIPKEVGSPTGLWTNGLDLPAPICPRGQHSSGSCYFCIFFCFIWFKLWVNKLKFSKSLLPRLLSKMTTIKLIVQVNLAWRLTIVLLQFRLEFCQLPL